MISQSILGFSIPSEKALLVVSPIWHGFGTTDVIEPAVPLVRSVLNPAIVLHSL